MSLNTVREILLKAGTDPDFRKIFFHDRETALEHYDLTDEEVQCLNEIKDENKLATVCQGIEEKSSFFASDIRI